LHALPYFLNGEFMYYRLIATLLLVSMLFACVSTLTSCMQGDLPDDDTPPIVQGGDPEKSIIKPQIKSYDRKTIDFDHIEYARPDAEKILSDFSSVTDIIIKNEIPYADQLTAVTLLEAGYSDLRTMYSYANILMSEDKRSTYWCNEYDYISSYIPSFSSTIEKLYVAAAQSEHATKFEADYFGEDLIEEYANGGIYTPELVRLMEEETAIENKYSAISTASVVITYKGRTDSFDGMMDFYSETFGEDTLTYKSAYEECSRLYEERASEMSRQMLVELLKLRKLIARELGYESYAEYAYQTMEHTYTTDQMLSFIGDVAQFVIPVYYVVSYYVLWPYFEQYDSTEPLDRVDLINTLYYVYEDMDSELFDIYSYMLQFGLYDVAGANDNRFNGSFCTYLDDYDAPYIFLSTNGDCTDYMTLAHEFGHFADYFINDGNEASLDVSEISSQALEYLTLTKLKGELDAEEYKYLHYSQLSSSFDVLLFQSFYALFEHYAYDIAYDSISEDTLVDAMKRAAADMGMSDDYFDTLDHVLIPHIMLYPFYVQSYPVSVSVALEIYYLESETEGKGLDAYLDLIDRENGNFRFEELIDDAGLTSPFSQAYLKGLADMIHYDILGSHFFKKSAVNNNAA